MQSIVNIATAKNTVKPVAEQPSVPVKKRARMVYLRAYDSVAFPVNAKELFGALGFAPDTSWLRSRKKGLCMAGILQP